MLQPFRGNPEYKDVAEMPYKTQCLQAIDKNETDLKTLGKEGRKEGREASGEAAHG